MQNTADPRPALASRIDQLRQRVKSLRVAAEDSPVSLDRRIVKLCQRIQESAWDAAAESQDLLPEQLLPNSQDGKSGPASTCIARVRELLGLVRPLREQLAQLMESDVFLDRPMERARLKQSHDIAELAEILIRQASTIQQQILMLPAWESMVRQASDRYAQLAVLVRRQQRRRLQVATLREIYCQLLAGGRPRWEVVVELAGRILHDLDAEAQPEITQSASLDASIGVATHAVNVAYIAGYLAASRESLRPHRVSAVIASLLADVGMLKDARGVFIQNRPLRDEERAQLERHPLESAALAERIVGFDPVLAKAISQHHERLDGSGYPAAASGEEVVAIAKILACADVYVAMRSRRVHRAAYDPSAALTGTLAEADAGRLDESIARGLLNLSLYPVGTVVELTTAEMAEVVATHDAQADPTLAARPIVKLLTDRRGNPVPAPTYRNLAARQDSRIVRIVRAEELYLRRQSA